MNDEHDEDPLGVERDHEKRGEGLPKEGPPVAQAASTYGSSFVESEEQAESIAEDASSDADASDEGV